MKDTSHNQKPSSNKSQIPKLLGKTVAHLQDGIDTLIAFGMNKLSKFEKSKPTDDSNKIIKVSKVVAGFIGKAGKSYYKEYEKLKKGKSDK